jgi:tetratricopeptide (TPR) repeat protein
VALDHYLTGQAAYDARHLAEGVAAFEAALHLEPTHYWSLMNLGYCLCDLGRGPEDFAGAARVFTGCILKRPDHAHAYYCRACAHSKLRHAKKALADYSRAVDFDPSHAGAWYSRGLTHSELGRLDDAVADYSRAVKSEPLHARAWLARGVAYHRLYQLRQAVADYSRAIALDPQFALAWSNRGTAYTTLGEPEKALRDCTKALEIDPKLALAWASRGYLYQTSGRSDEAVADYDRAIQLDPKLARAWASRGSVHLQAGRLDKALADCSRAVKLDSADAVAWNNRGGVYFRSRQWEQAVADYDRAIKLDPKYALAWNNRGNAYFQLGKWEKTLRDCSRAVALEPSSAPAWLNLGAAHTKLAQPNEALAAFSKVIQIKPKDEKGWLNRGIVYIGLEQPDKAVADLSRAIELAPDHPRVIQAYLLRAMSHSRLAHFGQVRADYHEFLKRAPNQPGALDALAWLLATCPDVKLRDPARAVELAGQAVRRAPKVRAYWKTLGVARYRAGDGKAAVAALNKSVELGPGGAVDRFFLAMAHWKLGIHDQARLAHAQAVRWLETNRAAGKRQGAGGRTSPFPGGGGGSPGAEDQLTVPVSAEPRGRGRNPLELDGVARARWRHQALDWREPTWPSERASLCLMNCSRPKGGGSAQEGPQVHGLQSLRPGLDREAPGGAETDHRLLAAGLSGVAARALKAVLRPGGAEHRRLVAARGDAHHADSAGVEAVAGGVGTPPADICLPRPGPGSGTCRAGGSAPWRPRSRAPSSVRATSGSAAPASARAATPRQAGRTRRLDRGRRGGGSQGRASTGCRLASRTPGRSHRQQAANPRRLVLPARRDRADKGRGGLGHLGEKA